MLHQILKHSTMDKKRTTTDQLSWLERTGMVYVNTKI
jgi:hypothetical protein